MNDIPLIQLIREDRIHHGNNAFAPGFQAIATHRLGVWHLGLPRWARALVAPVYSFLYGICRNVYGIEIPVTAKVGRRVVFGHQHGIVIHDFAEIGDGCILRHGVSLAAATGKSDYERWAKQAPRLGRDVKIGIGAVIIGNVSIGDGVHIGPNVVVTTNIPAGATVVATPPRVMKARAAAEPAAATGEVAEG